MIFGIGLSKTATKSLGKMMEMLNYKVLNSTGIINKLLDDNNRQSMGKLNYDVVIDGDQMFLYKEMSKAYPDAKFILTDRDFDEWLVSMVNHNLNKDRSVTKKDIERFITLYKNHKKDAQNFFGDKLLIMNLFTDENVWKKLCNFLGIDNNYQGYTIPHMNRAIKRHFNTIDQIENAYDMEIKPEERGRGSIDKYD